MAALTLRANSGLMHRSKLPHFDHVVGALLKNQRQVEAEWFLGVP
jgi:hypothetical protein